MGAHIDPFDIEWKEEDPLGREITMLKSIAEARSGKHTEPPEFLGTDDVRAVVSEPDRIDRSISKSSREIYYRVDKDADCHYSRAVVDFEKSDKSGIVVSWSRYRQPVSSSGVVYRKEGSYGCNS